jgi:S1/P1 Nuclease
MRSVPIVVATALLAAAQSAQAWNDRGHMMVAAIAWNSLEPHIRARATELIKLNPHYRTFLITGTHKPERDKVAFVRAATWPDFIKDLAKKPDEAGPGDYIDNGNDPADSPKPNQNIGYEDLHLHKYWHFKDIPFSKDTTPTKNPKEPNAETRIRLHRDTIASKDKTVDDDLKSYDLVWLLHLVGDVHQPLHGTQRFSAAHTDGDAGGNLVRVCEDPCEHTEKSLHSFWDGAGGANASVFSAIRAAERLDEADPDDVDITEPQKWIDESFELAKTFVYAKPIDHRACWRAPRQAAQ